MRFSSIVLFLWSTAVAGVEPGDCAYQLDRQLNEWTLPPVEPRVFNGVTRGGKNPFVTTGDFDNDKKTDVAFLIVKDNKTHIALCLSRKPERSLLISNLYCNDGIARVRKGAEYYNYETGSKGRYDRDGIHAYCHEKAGATYLYKRGVFKAIIDSD